MAADSEVQIEAGDRRWRRANLANAGGYRFRVEIPPGSKSLWVRARTAGGESSWELSLTEVRWLPLLVNVQNLLLQKDRPALLNAKRLLEEALPGLSRSDRGLALSQLARVERNLDDEAAAQQALMRAIPEHRAAGRVLDEADDSRLLAWSLIQQRDIAAARQVLVALELPEGSPAEAFLYRHFARGLLAEHVGDARTALAELGAGVELAERVGLSRQAYGFTQILARQLQALGRGREAADLFERLDRVPRKEVDPCSRAEMLVNQAWSLLLSREAGDKGRDPLPLILQSDEITRRESCLRSEESRRISLLNRALAHLQAGEAGIARATLEEARSLLASAPPLDRLWGLELEARLQLVEGDPLGALRSYAQLERLAAESLSPEGQWRAAYGRAQSAAALGRTGDALADCRRAEELLEAQGELVPIHEGRATFAAQRGRATEFCLGLWLDKGLNSEALAAARRERSRFLRDLARGDRLAKLGQAEQSTWDRAIGEYWRRRAAIDSVEANDRLRPADERRARKARREKELAEAQRALDGAFHLLGRAADATLPKESPGEVLLAYHPLAVGWVGFASDGRRVLASRFEVMPVLLGRPADLSALLLEPFRPMLEAATTKRLRVLPFGALRAIDFHSLPFGGAGRILLERYPIVYGLDLSPAAGRPAAGGERTALVVSNPTRTTRDLPAAEAEAQRVVEALRAQRPAWVVESLASARATAAEVRRVLPRVALFHYAGHGSFAGFDGWESELPLAGGTRLALGDLLTLGRVPPWVVLSGCDAGKAGTDAPGESLNLAHAFLLAGSRTVVAATRPVEDRAALLLFSDLYGGLSGSPDLAALLREAQIAAWRRGDAGDWAAFRAFEP